MKRYISASYKQAVFNEINADFENCEVSDYYEDDDIVMFAVDGNKVTINVEDIEDNDISKLVYDAVSDVLDNSEHIEGIDTSNELFRYYTVISDDTMDEYYEGHESIAEQLDGYDVKHLAWVAAYDEYYDALSDNGLEILELLEEPDGHQFLGYVIGDRLYSASLSEVERCILGV